MYISLYRKYRPQKFSDMVGQSAAISLLQESLKEDKIGHAYLFSGPRGCGKTSAARLIAKSLICKKQSQTYEPCGECDDCISVAMGEHLDVIEIDGASNRGINEIRDLKTHVNLKPLSAGYKIYIIDEVHMLTEPAFNALLKTLEEPPQNVVFLLATTEPHKVPVTIRSRCQQIPFHRISTKDMIERIQYVCDCENIKYDKESIWELARQADGALRDALSLTEQAIALGKKDLTLECIQELTGGSSRTELEEWVSTFSSDPSTCVLMLSKMLSGGMSTEKFCESLFSLFRDIWLYVLWGEKIIDSLEISDSGLRFLENQAKIWSADKLMDVCNLLNSLMPRARQGIRNDVFSGLILMKLMLIYEGNGKKVLNNINENTKLEYSSVWVKEDKAKLDNTVHTAISDEDNGIKKTVEVKEKQSIEKCCCLDNFENIDKNYKLLVSNLSSKVLLLSSALLYADIQIENGVWSISVKNNPVAKQILDVSLNKDILRIAMQDAFSAKENIEQKDDILKKDTDVIFSKSIKENDINFPSEKTNEKVSSDDNVKVATSSSHMLKLMMAEVLYIHENNDEADTPNGGTENV